MCPRVASLIFLFSINVALIQQSRNNQWMRFLNDNNDVSSLWATATLFNTILPGSHKSCMYKSQYELTADSYWKTVFSERVQAAMQQVGSLDDAQWERLSNWTTTQDGADINLQMVHGIRWFDLNFEYHTSSTNAGYNGWYAHNAIYGPRLDIIMNDFAIYKDTQELMVLHFSDFLPASVATSEPTAFLDFWTDVVQALGSENLVPSNLGNGVADLQGLLMTELQQDYTYILVSDSWADINPTLQDYVWDINDLYVGSATGATLAGVMKDDNRDKLEAGWAQDKLHRVYWTLAASTQDIVNAISTGVASIDDVPLTSYEQLNRRIIFQLQEAIDGEQLGSSRWGHVLIADFVGKSDLVDVVLKLNYNYWTCFDQDVGVVGDSTSCAYKKANGECSSAAGRCDRTCGQCTPTWLPGTLYDSCSIPADCVSLGASAATCKVMDDYYNLAVQPLRPQFCQVHDPYTTCAEYNDYYDALTGYSSCSATGLDNSFSSPAEQEAYWTYTFKQSCFQCASDAQCLSGICNKDFQVCIQPRLRANLTTDDFNTTSKPAYVRFESDACETFRSDIDMFRFQGEPDADFDFDSINSAMEEVQQGQVSALLDDDYLASIFCFALFPILLGIIMMLLLVCTPMCWCCAKYKPSWCRCCCCFGKKKDNGKGALSGKRQKDDSNESLQLFEYYCCCYTKDKKYTAGEIYVPMALLLVYSVLILFFCANAIVMNGEISDNILSKGGVIELMNDTMTYASDFMDGVVVPTNALVDGLDSAFDRAQELVDGTSEAQGLIDDVTTKMDTLATNWASGSLDVIVISPTTSNVLTYFCTNCRTQIAALPTMQTEVSNYAVSSSQDMYSVVGDIQRDMLDEEDTIMVDVLDYQEQVTSANEQTKLMRTNVLETMDMIEGVEDNRSVVFAIFFMIPILLLILGVCGFCDGHELGRKCFRLNYCLAFTLSTVTWILFGFFDITVIIWADTCVRLDVMETDITGSVLLDQVYSTDTVKKVMDACINGKYLPDAFNISSSIGFKELENQIVSQLTVDITGSFDIASTNSFRDFVTTLDGTSYYYTVDQGISEFNAQYSQSITRSSLGADTNPPTNTPVGLSAEGNARYAELRDLLENESPNLPHFNVRATQFQVNATQFLVAYERLEDYTVNNLQANLTDIKCSLNPVFEQADILLYGNETAWCNQVGVLYGEMKQKSCVDLFQNFEYTNRSLLVVAIFSMFIGFLSVCLGRRINRQHNLHLLKAWNFGNAVM